MTAHMQSGRPARGRCEGMRRIVETDLAPRLPFHVDPGWYNAYWDGSEAGSTPGCLRRALHRIRRLLAGMIAAERSPPGSTGLAGALRLPLPLCFREQVYPRDHSV